MALWDAPITAMVVGRERERYVESCGGLRARSKSSWRRLGYLDGRHGGFGDEPVQRTRMGVCATVVVRLLSLLFC